MSLAGKGIWYGRVEPRHVEGIVEETVLGGRVISEHFRDLDSDIVESLLKFEQLDMCLWSLGSGANCARGLVPKSA
ncbi:hypothetical protein EMPG_17845 [Blastomyces silverae]|uniref:Uncharacterized protein n=1 Tax=Blastomyces silverae TaxID=2060906 RepID=A0A0H1B5F3_9EURO|nr:hypothetical protein EMPG_17845 [Blastomyces silverae]